MFSQRRQGDVCDFTNLPVLASHTAPLWRRLLRQRVAPQFVEAKRIAIVSQTCDLVREVPPTVLVAPVVDLPDAEAAPARRGQRSRFVHLPRIGLSTFIDLEVIATAEKALLAPLTFVRGVEGVEEERRLSYLLGRRLSRFPFPDEIHPWLAPLREVARKKYGSPGSAEGQMFGRVAELRIEASSPDGQTDPWASPPYALTLVVILEAGELPNFDGPPLMPNELATWARRHAGGPTSDQIARRLLEEIDKPIGLQDERARHHLWWMLAEAWAAKCRPKGSVTSAVRDAVAGGSLAVDLVSVDEYPLSRYRRSESLDLEHLSHQ